MEKPVIILGAGRIGQAALDIFESNGVSVYCFLDDDKELHGTEIGEVSVLGAIDDDKLLGQIGPKTGAFVASDENKFRKSLVEMLRDRDVMPVNAIHSTAFISESAPIGHGNMFDTGVLINSGATIGNHCLLFSGSVIDHNAKVEDFVQIGPGSIIGSGAVISESAFIGAGVTVVGGVTIGKKARVGAGSVVVSDVKNNETVFGNPAKGIEK